MLMIYSLLKTADEMDIDHMYAMNARRRFITKQLWDIEVKIAEWVLVPWQNEWDVAIFLYFMELSLGMKNLFKKELEVIDRMIFKAKDQITEEMIERARSTPIEMILEFIRGKIRCIDLNHNDKHPSAYYGRRTNRLVCPVCQKTWDAIACYQYVHDCDFKTAVKALQQ